MSDLPTIVDAVEFRMEQYGHNQTEACRIMKIPRSNFSEFLKGKRRVPRSWQFRLHAYGIPAVVLIQKPIKKRKI